MSCEECGTATCVQPYDDPETGEPISLCRSCAAQVFGDDDEEEPYETDADPDLEFADTCITAADYFREGDY